MKITRSLVTRINQAGKKLAAAMEHCSSLPRAFIYDNKGKEEAKKKLNKAWDNWNNLIKELESMIVEES